MKAAKSLLLSGFIKKKKRKDKCVKYRNMRDDRAEEFLGGLVDISKGKQQMGKGHCFCL